jgi:hypothetical protein
MATAQYVCLLSLLPLSSLKTVALLHAGANTQSLRCETGVDSGGFWLVNVAFYQV